jgi:two-component system response regulator
MKHIDILLVEDNPHEAKLTITSLKRNNLADNLFHVDDGAEALDFIFARGIYADRQSEVLPKVILLDLNLPKIGGLDVLARIKSNPITKSISVVILTSSKDDRDIATGYANGANSYIVKPVNFDSFSKAVTDLGLYWLLLNEPPPGHPIAI